MSGSGGPLPDRPTRMETEPGVFRDLDALSRDAAVQALRASEAPIERADELVAAITGNALRAVVLARVRQIVKHGHSAENDDLLPIGWLPMEARLKLQAVRAQMIEQPRDLAAIRELLVEATALGMASIDRIDRGLQAGES